MANKSNLRISVIESDLKRHCNDILNAIDSAAGYATKLTDAQAGDNVITWGRTLYGTADTGIATLTVNATAKTVSCIAGAGLFANFRVGRDVFLSNFTNGGNSTTAEVTALISADSIEISGATTLVDETDTTARVRENPTAEEQDFVTAITTVRSRFTELQNAIDNIAVATADRRADLIDWTW